MDCLRCLQHTVYCAGPRPPSVPIRSHRPLAILLACLPFSSSCSVLYLAYKHADSFEDAVLANTNVGGENCHRGSALGALVGARPPPFPCLARLLAHQLLADTCARLPRAAGCLLCGTTSSQEDRCTTPTLTCMHARCLRCADGSRARCLGHPGAPAGGPARQQGHQHRNRQLHHSPVPSRGPGRAEAGAGGGSRSRRRQRGAVKGRRSGGCGGAGGGVERGAGFCPGLLPFHRMRLQDVDGGEVEKVIKKRQSIL